MSGKSFRMPSACRVCVLLACLAFAAEQARAQAGGLIIDVHTTTRDSTVMTVDKLTASLSPGQRVALSGLLDVSAQGLAGKLDELIGGGGDALLDKYTEAKRGLGDASKPTTTSLDYEIYVRGDTMALVMDGQVMMVWEAPEGKPARVISPGPGTKPLNVPLPLLDSVTGVGATAESGEWAATLMFNGYSKPSRVGGATKQILGTTTQLYRYGYSILPAATNVAGIRTDVAGGAWVTGNSEYRDQIAAFYRAFADGAAGGQRQPRMMSGLTTVMADITALGVPLATADTARTYLAFVLPDAGEPVKSMMAVSVSTSEIKSIRREPPGFNITFVDDDPQQPGSPPGAQTRPPARQGCDCSCDAWKAFKALEKKSKEEIRADPTIMAKAMCASQCATKWVSCGG